MMANQEEEDKKHKQLLEKIKRLCDELSPWEVFQIYLYIKSMAVQDKMREIALNWLIFQLDLGKGTKARNKIRSASAKR